ncbi:MAG TPA: hypothetical protein EYH38_04805, partial [Leucothrix sp.]|nr:hypothetical protein [Leucothrix sp.]
MTTTLLKYKLLIIVLAFFSTASLANEEHLFNLNIENLTPQVKPKIDSRFSQKSASPSIKLPLPSGQFVSFTAQETQVLPPKLAKKYADIKTYSIHSKNQDLSGRMSLSAQGAYISIHSKKGREAFIGPVTDRSKSYISQWKDEMPTNHHQQLRDDQIFTQPQQEQLPKLLHRKTSDSTSARLIQYRIAVAANSHFVADQGGDVATALAAIAHIINRINHIFERDLGIHLVLVENNDLLIFNNASNDPYYGSLHEMAFQNQEVIDRIIGSENYDLGHLFAAQGGGAAYVQSACRDRAKAIAVSANLAVGYERFATEFVAHEIGHQFGATHTFSSNKG